MSADDDPVALRRQLAQAKRLVSTQQAEIDLLRQQVRSQQLRLDERSDGLLHSQRLLAARIERLQDDCERVASLLTSPPPSVRLKRLPSWLPRSVALLLHEFSHSPDPSTLDSRLSSFLIALNRIWRQRVEQRGQVVAARYEAEVAELKRRLARRLPYELITQKARILRLQKELDDTRRVHRQRRERGGGEREEDSHLLRLALAAVENLSAQLIEMERQNDALRRAINEGDGPAAAENSKGAEREADDGGEEEEEERKEEKGDADDLDESQR